MATTAKKKIVTNKTTLFDEKAAPGIVDPKLLRHLQDHFGFDGFKQNQGAIIKIRFKRKRYICYHADRRGANPFATSCLP